ncbi:hypothetical protein EON65_47225 [archaeon]|nr:MAG: hypothetical protein EON65_47225 [archaeon]
MFSFCFSPHAADSTSPTPTPTPAREVSFVMRGKKRANNPNPLSSLSPKEDSLKQRKKAERKFRK